jgi:hypothetical protein
MLTADEKIALIRQKIERAKQHISNLKIANDAFLDTEPYAFTTQINAQTGEQEFHAARDFQVAPDEIALIVGDVVHNLRAALDHLAFQLWLNSPLRTGSGRHVYYPIAESADKYKAEHMRKVKGMTDDAIHAIGATEPYQGGKGDALWVINELDIADKHRTLLVSDVRVSGFKLYPTKSFFQDDDWVRSLFSFTAPKFRATAKAGDLLFTVKPEMYKDVNLEFSIAFSDPNVIEGHSVLVSLQQLTNTVDHLILGFKPLLV